MPEFGGLTKQEHVYQVLRERIVTGAYGPGYRLVIDTVAGEFGVSTLPVREAVRRLEALGLVVVRPNAGAQVADAYQGHFDQDMTIVALLEGYATALAAPDLGEDGISRLRSVNEEMVAAMDHLDALTFSRLNNEFHALIYEHCTNAPLIQLLRDVVRPLDTVVLQMPHRGAESIVEHRNLIELIAAGAPSSEIEAAAREHKLRAVEGFRAWQSVSG